MALSMNSVGIPGGFRGNAGFRENLGFGVVSGDLGGQKAFAQIARAHIANHLLGPLQFRAHSPSVAGQVRFSLKREELGPYRLGGSCKSRFLLNSGHFSLEKKEHSHLNCCSLTTLKDPAVLTILRRSKLRSP